MIRLAIFLCLLAHPLFAGAWAREEGRFFASASVMTPPGSATDDALVMLYGEYGLRTHVTIGFDAHGPAKATQNDARGQVIGFARLQFLQKGKNIWAMSLGAGADLGTQTMPFVRLGGHWGRGEEAGWISADAYADLRQDQRPRYKLDITRGWRLTDVWAVQAQVQGSRVDGQSYWSLEPSIMYKIKDTFTIHAAISQPQDGAAQIKLGVWLHL